jgi:hypothetical protein
MANYDEFGICIDPIKVKDHVESIDVRYSNAISVVKHLQRLINTHGNGDINMEYLNYDDEKDVVFTTHRMETPEEAKIRYDKQRKQRMKYARQDYETLKKIFEG